MFRTQDVTLVALVLLAESGVSRSAAGHTAGP